MALIELDLDASPTPPPQRPPVRWYRPAGLLLAGLLALTLGGAAPAVSTVWQRLGVVPVDGEDSSYALAGGGIYAVDPAQGGRWRISAWTGEPLRRAWSVTTGTPRAAEDGTGYAGVNLVAAGGDLLVQDTGTTTVVDVRTGAVRWSTPGPLQSLGSGMGVTTETAFRPGTEYDVAGGAPGDLYFSATGRPHTEPPRRTTLHGVDMATGRRLWSSGHRGSVRTALLPGDRAALVVVSADRLALLAGDTGAALRATPLPRTGDVAWVEFAGDLVLIRRGPLDEPGTMSAYAMDTLAFRWQTADAAVAGAYGFCAGLACGNVPSGRMVLDAGTGRGLWPVDEGLSVVRRGGSAVEVGSGGERPVRVRDVSTGAVRARLTSWDTVLNREGDGSLVVRRAETGRGVTTFGALPPGSRAVRPLGTVPGLVDDCLADDAFVACRTAAGVEVWSYRA